MMPYDDPNLKEFAGYFQAKEPGRRERAENAVRKSGQEKAVRKQSSGFGNF